MRANWKKFGMIFLLLECAILLSGCTAAWLGTISALLPAIETAVTALVSFVAALEGKTVSATFAASVTQIGNDVASEIANVQQLVASYTSATATTVIGKIQTLLQSISTQLSSILSDANITDASTVGKITNFVSLAVAAVGAVLAVIPLAMAKLAKPGVTEQELAAEDKLASKQVQRAHSQMQSAYVEIVTTTTTNPDVNAALKTLPQQLP